MRPSEDPSEKITLIVEAGDPIVEIFVIDGQFNLVARESGYLETALPPGLYKVKFKAGTIIKETKAILEPGSGSVLVSAPELDFSTPAPLANTRTSRPDHIQPAYEISRRPPVRLGKGGQLFLFVRDLKSGLDTDPAQGLSLRSLNGDRLVNFGELGQRSLEEQWAGCLLELDPGDYRLRMQTHVTGSLEQTIVVVPGWQTQAFLLRRPFGKTERKARRADLSNAAILMSPVGEGFQPEREDLRWTELARLGLAGGHCPVSAEELQTIYLKERPNPVLGLFCAHLLLISSKADLAAITRLVENLRDLLGDHPDVKALMLRLSELRQRPTSISPFLAPPMLRSSWEIVVKASAGRPDLVPPNSLSEQISARLWGAGSWLVWQPFYMHEKPPASGEDLPELSDSLHQIEDLLSEEPAAFKSAVRSAGLDDLEEGLLRYLAAGLTQPGPSHEQEVFLADSLAPYSELVPAEEEGDRLTSDSLVRALGVPDASARRAAASLIEKLQQKPTGKLPKESKEV
jgi:hypothetical protein